MMDCKQYRDLSVEECGLDSIIPGCEVQHSQSLTNVIDKKLHLTVVKYSGKRFGLYSKGKKKIPEPSQKDRDYALAYIATRLESGAQYDSLNSYDRCSHSLGPIQTPTRWGSIQKQLHKYYHRNPYEFADAVEAHGYITKQEGNHHYLLRIDDKGEANKMDASEFRTLHFNSVMQNLALKSDDFNREQIAEMMDRYRRTMKTLRPPAGAPEAWLSLIYDVGCHFGIAGCRSIIRKSQAMHITGWENRILRVAHRVLKLRDGKKSWVRRLHNDVSSKWINEPRFNLKAMLDG